MDDPVRSPSSTQQERRSSPVRPDPVERVKEMLDRWIARAAEHAVLALIRRGEPTAIVMPADEYEGYLHTMEIEQDQEAQEAIRRGEEDLRAGRVTDYEAVRRDLGLA